MEMNSLQRDENPRKQNFTMSRGTSTFKEISCWILVTADDLKKSAALFLYSNKDDEPPHDFIRAHFPRVFMKSEIRQI